ncbi:hypothetical protein [Pilibacter termitis]|nr:hypothetical protein [Pilibacter termitis]
MTKHNITGEQIQEASRLIKQEKDKKIVLRLMVIVLETDLLIDLRE